MRRDYFKFILFTFLGVIGLSSCTNLEIKETDSIISEGFQGLADASSSVNDLYGSLNGEYGTQEDIYALMEVTADAAIVPTRGGDWGDNGRWRVLHQHAWTEEQLFVVNTFGDWNAIQLRASQILDPRSNPTAGNIGDASMIRAWAVWVILDLYGQVPFRDVTLPSSTIPEVLTGADAISLILSDLDTAISNLPATQAGSGDDNGRGSKAAARYLKAKVLLNKHIYLGGTPEQSDLSEVVSLVDAITADGYALQSGYFDIFRESADSETILWLAADVGTRIYNGLHYNSTTVDGGGWNGFATLAEYYDLFEGDANNNRFDAADGNALDGQEERRGGVPPAGKLFSGEPGTSDNGGFENGSNVGYGFLVGQQYDLDGTALNSRPGPPLNFSRDFVDGSGAASFINNSETTGIRVIKYQPRYGGRLNHMVVFRYADAYLMKAEAMLRLGQDITAMVNDLRSLRGASTFQGSVTEQDLLDERARELFAEGWRRNDLIRFGQYGRDWLFKEPSSVNNPDRQIFPIPAPQLLANPNLVQNPGY
ncbi:MAG: RagB/SusD family nutrient uptake outer membrane protein [Flavobacteriaceae bacterium]